MATVFSGACAQDANCRLENGLDLVIAFSAYAQTPAGKLLVQHLNEVADRPAVAGLLDPSALSEDGFLAIVKALLPAIQNAKGDDLEAAFNTLPLSQAVKDDFRPLLNDIKVLLANKALIDPTNKALFCIWGDSSRPGKDANFDVMRMLYRLTIRDKLPAFSLSTVSAVFKGLQEVDSRGALIFLAGTLASAVRNEDQAIDSAAKVCTTLFSTSPAMGQARSNAELILPTTANLIRDGIIGETICAIDTLVFGCAGGAQPACVATCLGADGGLGVRTDAGVCR